MSGKRSNEATLAALTEGFQEGWTGFPGRYWREEFSRDRRLLSKFGPKSIDTPKRPISGGDRCRHLCGPRLCIVILSLWAWMGSAILRPS
jgi:hypothetical protein